MTVLRSGSATDIGRVRSTNQDVALEDPDLFAVADGMGGAVGGDVAARVAVDALRAAFQREPTVEGLRHAIAEANRAVWRQGQAEAGLRGMGTTLTATGLVQEPSGKQVIALANVGDSRAYVFSRGQVLQVTADHSVAEEKVRLGELTEAEAAVHPHRHILTRVLGVSPDVDVDLWELHLKHGDRILLCSDGLTNEVGDDRIRAILSSVADPREAASTLVKAAVDHGGSDNVTVVVVDVDDSDAAVGAAGAGRGVPLAAGTAAGAAAGTAARSGTAGDGDEAGAGATVGAGAPADTAPARKAPAGRDGDGARGFRRVSSNTPNGQALARASGAGDGGAIVSALADRRIRAGSPRRADGADGVAGADGVDGDDREEGVGAGVGAAVGAGAGAVALAGTLPFTGPATSVGFKAAELRRWQPSRPGRRKKRRRGAGAPRLVTVRLVLFFVLVAAIVAAAYALVRWYAMNDWYVGLDHDHLAVYQGRPGGFLWFKPQLVDESPVTIHGVPSYAIAGVRQDRQEPSLGAARRYVSNLHQEFLDTRPPGSATTTSNGASGSTSTSGTASPSSPSSTGSAP